MPQKDFFFNWEKIQKEELKKKQSLLISPKELFKNFSTFLLKKFDKNEIKGIEDFFSNLSNLDFDKIYKNYMSHPIRVAHMWALINHSVSASEIKFALAHNIIENGFLNEIKNCLEKKEIEKIKILTIDRNKEKNLNYLNIYYSNIENHSKNLFIFKSLDKLDNLLIGEKYLFDDYALNLLRKQICSRLKKHNMRLHDYIYDAANFYEQKYY